MATTKRNGLPDFWCTGLAKALVGDQPCLLQPWMKAHYNLDKQPRSSDFAKWKLQHTEQLNAEVQRLKLAGWTCSVEQYFKLKGETASISGKSDIIARQGDTHIILDVKSGTPRDSDVAQVMIYQVVTPMVWRRTLPFRGEVVYPDHRVPVSVADALAIRDRLFALVRQLAKDERPDASPSESACLFCDVTAADCPQRFAEGAAIDVLTSEF
jgi:hypothetical protein